MLEISGHPKPGNVHRTQDFNETRFEHFLAGIAAIQPCFHEFCQRVYSNATISVKNYSFVRLGTLFKDATDEMMKWQKGGNVLLGHILILAPLASSTAICLKRRELSLVSFVKTIRKIIDDATVQDTIDLYDAIRTCNPGGLGKIDKYDLNDENVMKDLIKDEITLKKIFEFSRDHDSISLEYSTGLNIIINEGLPFFVENFNNTLDINDAVVNTFLKVLADHPDTLIIRKSGLHEALKVSKKAAEIIKTGGISTEKGKKLILEFDNLLKKENGRLNPGTTADLVAGIIFCALIFGLKF